MDIYLKASTFDNLKTSFTDEQGEALVSSFRAGKSFCLKIGAITYDCRIKPPPLSVFEKLPVTGLAVGSDGSSYTLTVGCPGATVRSNDTLEEAQVLYYLTQPPGAHITDIAHGRDNQKHRLAIRSRGFADALKVWTKGLLKYGDGNVGVDSVALLIALILFELYEQPLSCYGD